MTLTPHYATILVLILPVMKADCISDLQPTPSQHRLAVSTDRTDYVVTNDLTQDSTAETQQVCVIRWKIEQLYQEVKQMTGLERCQCRKSRIQRNHIACAMLVWCRLKELAYATGRTVYQIKSGQLSDYLIQQLRSPSVKMALA